MKIINTRKLAKGLALGIEHRGYHATGVAFRTPTGSCPIQIHKKDIPASEFVKRMPMPIHAQVGLIHTRFATQGDPNDNNNNHPIANAGIVGVHNGHVSNDDDLFKMVYEAGGERHGQVDSEAIFAAIAWNVARWPHTNVQLGDVLEGVRGGAAVAWLDEADQDDILHVSRISSSPLVMSWTEGGSLIFASEYPAIKDATAAVGVNLKGHPVYMTEGTCYTITAGDITHKVDFAPAWKSYTPRHSDRAVDAIMARWNRQDRDVYDEFDDVEGEVPPFSPIPLPAVGRASGTTEEDDDPTVSILIEDLTSPMSLSLQAGTLYFDVNLKREEAVRKFDRCFTTTAAKQKNDVMWRLHAFARVGTWVKTLVQGVDSIGQVYQMPQTFPHGFYLLRVHVYSPERPDDEEWVLVARKHAEFTRCQDQNLQSNGDIAATEALQARLAEAKAEEEKERSVTEEIFEWALMQDA